MSDSNSPVLVLSTDPQGSTVWWAERIEESPFDFADAHEEPDQLKKLKDLTQYDHIFIDTPGSLEHEHMLAAALDQADDVIVPVLPEPLALDPAKRTINEVIKPSGLPFTVVVNKWDPRDGVLDRDDTIAFVDNERWERCGTVVRHYKVHTRAALEGRVVTQYPKNRISMEAREDFRKLALELGFGPTKKRGKGPKVHVVANQKGGVGKTTVVMNLAAVVADALGGK